jgi:hypothetical protein
MSRLIATTLRRVIFFPLFVGASPFVWVFFFTLYGSARYANDEITDTLSAVWGGDLCLQL